MTDHYDSAKLHLEDVEAFTNDAHAMRFNKESRERIYAALAHAPIAALAAQAEATLALAEQQRIANLIELSKDDYENIARPAYGELTTWNVDGVTYRPDIARTLRIEKP